MLYGFGKSLVVSDTDHDTGTLYYSIKVANAPVVTAQITSGSANMVVTIEATLFPADGDVDYAEETEVWTDITAAFTDLGSGMTGVSSVSNETKMLQINGLCASWLRFKCVAAADDQTVKIWVGRM